VNIGEDTMKMFDETDINQMNRELDESAHAVMLLKEENAQLHRFKKNLIYYLECRVFEVRRGIDPNLILKLIEEGKFDRERA
jgi:hypothetical protein